ncbi:MAG: metallophosphoesterase [bacterium]|nr:metallophosphoesterase [bacterium]
MKYIYIILNISSALFIHFLLYSVWIYFYHIDNIYLQMTLGALLFLSVVLTVLAPTLVHLYDSIVSRALYLVIALWWGLMLNIALVAGALFLLEGLGIVFSFSLSDSIRVIAIGIVPLLMLLPEAWAAQSHKIIRATVKIKDLPAAWAGKEVVHISDVHLGPIWRQRFYDNLVAKINSLNPAAVFISGDLFDGMETDFSWFRKRIINTSYGVYYALGNHDLNLGANRVRSLLADSGIEILENNLKEVEGLQILGLTCYYEGRLDVKGKILESVGYDDKKPSIMLYHEPKDTDAAAAAGIDLQLSGHTHAGQMFPLNLVSKLLYSGFQVGVHNLNGFTISHTAGAGTWGPPLRLGRRSEIVLLKLEPAVK